MTSKGDLDALQAKLNEESSKRQKAESDLERKREVLYFSLFSFPSPPLSPRSFLLFDLLLILLYKDVKTLNDRLHKIKEKTRDALVEYQKEKTALSEVSPSSFSLISSFSSFLVPFLCHFVITLLKKFISLYFPSLLISSPSSLSLSLSQLCLLLLYILLLSFPLPYF